MSGEHGGGAGATEMHLSMDASVFKPRQFKSWDFAPEFKPVFKPHSQPTTQQTPQPTAQQTTQPIFSQPTPQQTWKFGNDFVPGAKAATAAATPTQTPTQTPTATPPPAATNTPAAPAAAAAAAAAAPEPAAAENTPPSTTTTTTTTATEAVAAPAAETETAAGSSAKQKMGANPLRTVSCPPATLQVKSQLQEESPQPQEQAEAANDEDKAPLASLESTEVLVKPVPVKASTKRRTTTETVDLSDALPRSSKQEPSKQATDETEEKKEKKEEPREDAKKQGAPSPAPTQTPKAAKAKTPTVTVSISLDATPDQTPTPADTETETEPAVVVMADVTPEPGTTPAQELEITPSLASDDSPEPTTDATPTPAPDTEQSPALPDADTEAKQASPAAETTTAKATANKSGKEEAEAEGAAAETKKTGSGTGKKKSKSTASKKSKGAGAGAAVLAYTLEQLRELRAKAPELPAAAQSTLDSLLMEGGKGEARSKGGARGKGKQQQSARNPLAHSEYGYKWKKEDEAEGKEQKKREIMQMLNKLVEENKEEVVQKLLEMDYEQDEELYDFLVQSIFQKAVQEPLFIQLYTYVCKRLAGSLRVDLPPVDGKKPTFKRLLFHKCQKNFEDGAHMAEDAGSGAKTPDLIELHNQLKVKKKIQYLGNVMFTMHLYDAALLPEKVVVVACVRILCNNIRGGDYSYVEPLCKLFQKVGEKLDASSVKYREQIDNAYAMLHDLSARRAVSNRDRFMIDDLLELRRKWRPHALLQRRNQTPPPRSASAAPAVVVTSVALPPPPPAKDVRNLIRTALDEYLSDRSEESAFQYFDDEVRPREPQLLLPVVLQYALDKCLPEAQAVDLAQLLLRYNSARDGLLAAKWRPAMEKLAEALKHLDEPTDRTIALFARFMAAYLLGMPAADAPRASSDLVAALVAVKAADVYFSSKERKHGFAALLLVATLRFVADGDRARALLLWQSTACDPAAVFVSEHDGVELLQSRGLAALLAPFAASADKRAAFERALAAGKDGRDKAAALQRLIDADRDVLQDPALAVFVVDHVLTHHITGDTIESASDVIKQLECWRPLLVTLLPGGDRATVRAQCGVLDLLFQRAGNETSFSNLASAFCNYKCVRECEVELWRDVPVPQDKREVKKLCVASIIDLCKRAAHAQ